MYLISSSSRLQLPVRAASVKYHPETGAVIETIDPITLVFQPTGTIPGYAKEAVSRLSNFGRGIGEGVDPFSRCGVFDLSAAAAEEGWDEKTVAEIEERLRKTQGSTFVVAEPPRAEKPWEKYDEVDDLEQALYTIDLIGVDPGTVLEYETQNKNRPKFVEAFEALVSEEAGDEVVGVVSA